MHAKPHPSDARAKQWICTEVAFTVMASVGQEDSAAVHLQQLPVVTAAPAASEAAAQLRWQAATQARVAVVVLQKGLQ